MVFSEESGGAEITSSDKNDVILSEKDLPPERRKAEICNVYLRPLLEKHSCGSELNKEDLILSYKLATDHCESAARGEESHKNKKRKVESTTDELDDLPQKKALDKLHESLLQSYENAAKSALLQHSSSFTYPSLSSLNVASTTKIAPTLSTYIQHCLSVVQTDPNCAGWKVDDKIKQEYCYNHIQKGARGKFFELKRGDVTDAMDVANKSRALQTNNGTEIENKSNNKFFANTEDTSSKDEEKVKSEVKVEADETGGTITSSEEKGVKLTSVSHVEPAEEKRENECPGGEKVENTLTPLDRSNENGRDDDDTDEEEGEVHEDSASENDEDDDDDDHENDDEGDDDDDHDDEEEEGEVEEATEAAQKASSHPSQAKQPQQKQQPQQNKQRKLNRQNKKGWKANNNKASTVGGGGGRKRKAAATQSQQQTGGGRPKSARRGRGRGRGRGRK